MKRKVHVAETMKLKDLVAAIKKPRVHVVATRKQKVLVAAIKKPRVHAAVTKKPRVHAAVTKKPKVPVAATKMLKDLAAAIKKKPKASAAKANVAQLNRYIVVRKRRGALKSAPFFMRIFHEVGKIVRGVNSDICQRGN